MTQATLTPEETSELLHYFLDPDTRFQMVDDGFVIAKLKDGHYTAAVHPRTLLEIIRGDSKEI